MWPPSYRFSRASDGAPVAHVASVSACAAQLPESGTTAGPLPVSGTTKLPESGTARGRLNDSTPNGVHRCNEGSQAFLIPLRPRRAAKQRLAVRTIEPQHLNR